MSEKRFTIVGEEYVGYTQGNAYIISNGECKFSLWESKEDAQKICDYLNEQQATISALKEENEQLRQELKEYKENWDDMVELATKTSRRNVELDEQIGQLQRENEMLKKEIGRLNGLLFGTPKEAIE